MPQDRLVEQQRPTGVDRPPEAQPQRHDLQARLERLRVGHPSSPYHDDGSRKPSVDLAQYELPLPDERDSSAEPEPLAEDRAYIGPDGSWTWKDCHLAPEANRAADRGLAERRDAEGRDADGNYGDRGLTPLCAESRPNSTAAPSSKTLRSMLSKNQTGSKRNSTNC